MKTKTCFSNLFIMCCFFFSQFVVIADNQAHPQNNSEHDFNTKDHSQSDKVIYKLQAGETLKDIAARYLGGEAYTNELMEYNKISDASNLEPGFVIVLPGIERQDAINKIGIAKKALERAIIAQAETYCQPEFKFANDAVIAAENYRKEAAYDKASALAELGVIRSETAKRLADERAIIRQAGKITAVQGVVEISTDNGNTWSLAKEGMEVPVGVVIRTDKSGRAEIIMGDDSLVQILEASEFNIKEYSLDRRSQKRNSELQVTLGNILGKMKKQQHKESVINVNSRGTVLAIRGTDFRFGNDYFSTTRLSLLDGDILVKTAKADLDLESNFGTVIEERKAPSSPIELLPPPVVTTIPLDYFESSKQVFELRWEPVTLLVQSSKARKPNSQKRIAVKYHFEIARDEKFNYLIQNHVISDNFLMTDVIAPGDYFWRISSIDDNGLEGPSTIPGRFRIIRNQKIEFLVDDTAIQLPDRWIIGPQQNIRLHIPSSDHSVAAFEYSLNNTPYQATDGIIYFSQEGLFLVKARGLGADGFAGDSIQQRVEVDRTPPVISGFASPPMHDDKDGDYVYVTLDVTDVNGVKAVLYRINDGAYQTYPGKFKLSINNPYIGIDVKAVDIYGKDYMDKHFKRPLQIKIDCQAIDMLGNISHETINLTY